jgi:hypothetical protein
MHEGNKTACYMIGCSANIATTTTTIIANDTNAVFQLQLQLLLHPAIVYTIVRNCNVTRYGIVGQLSVAFTILLVPVHVFKSHNLYSPGLPASCMLLTQ